MRRSIRELFFKATVALGLSSSIAAASASTLGYLIYRVYQPTGGASKVSLPSLTFTFNDGRAPRTVTPCVVPLGLTPRGLANTVAGVPSCAWVATSGGGFPAVSANMAFPDTSAIYWVTAFMADGVANIDLHGRFPDARYMSVNVYDATLSSFTSNGLSSGLADYLLEPDSGSTNPWQVPAAAGGQFSVRISTGGQAGQTNTLPMPPLSGTTLPTLPAPCAADQCPPPDQFVRMSLSGLFPNVDNAYITAIHQPQSGQVLVLRGKLPTVPGAVTATHPQPWPNDALALRYWSVCNNVYKQPYPVTACVPDNELPRDAQGYYTVVVGAPSDRPGNARAAQGVAWLSNSVTQPAERHAIIVRNMLPHNFAQAIQNVPINSPAATTQEIMQAYYPQAWTCAKATFEQGGWQACVP
jgi:hypothetical protein